MTAIITDHLTTRYEFCTQSVVKHGHILLLTWPIMLHSDAHKNTSYALFSYLLCLILCCAYTTPTTKTQFFSTVWICLRLGHRFTQLELFYKLSLHFQPIQPCACKCSCTSNTMTSWTQINPIMPALCFTTILPILPKEYATDCARA